MTTAEIDAAIMAFMASVETDSPTYKRRRTMSVNLTKDPWPNVSVASQIITMLARSAPSSSRHERDPD